MASFRQDLLREGQIKRGVDLIMRIQLRKSKLVENLKNMNTHVHVAALNTHNAFR